MASRDHFSCRFVRWRGHLLGMASGGHFSYGFVRWRDLPGPIARKWLPEATFRIDLYAGGSTLGHLLGNGFRRPLFVWILHWQDNCWEMASRGPFAYTFARWQDFFPGGNEEPCAPSVNHPPSSPKYAIPGSTRYQARSTSY